MNVDHQVVIRRLRQNELSDIQFVRLLDHYGVRVHALHSVRPACLVVSYCRLFIANLSYLSFMADTAYPFLQGRRVQHPLQVDVSF